MADSQGEKTEKPSPKKLREAKEKGQVPRSRDLTTATTSLAATGVLATSGYFLLQRTQASVASGITRLAHTPLRDVDPGELVSIAVAGGLLIAVAVGPIAIVSAAISVATAAGQGGLRFSGTPIKVNWGRLNPAEGLKRLKPSSAGIDTLKAILITVSLGFVAWQIVRELAGDSLRLIWTTPLSSARYGWTFIIRFLWQAGFVLLAFGLADYGLQYWRHIKSLKMTRKELQDEASASDGRPEVKGRIKKIQRDMVRRRMLQATSRATVVITNPTHFAVALEYRREKSPAPVVVAKGQDLLAGRIREIARANSIPIVENPPLARALYKGAEVGETIPADLFSAVAEVLAYLIRIKQLMF
jgi:flagellar biosynthetic protein FlhB